MNPLMQQMMQRAAPPSQAGGGWPNKTPQPNRQPGWTFQPQGPGAGAATPPAQLPKPVMGAPHEPSPDQRQQNAMAMTQAYQNNWQPNPMLLKAMMTRG